MNEYFNSSEAIKQVVSAKLGQIRNIKERVFIKASCNKILIHLRHMEFAKPVFTRWENV